MDDVDKQAISKQESIEIETQRKFAVETNGRIWQLLEKKERSQLEDDELLYVAHASAYHWLKAGTGINQQRGEYLISKAYLSLNLPEAALRHAQRCMELTEQHREEAMDFDRAYAQECLARAYAINGHRDASLKYYKLARKSGDEIQGVEAKKIFDADFKGGDWFGIV